MRLVCIYAQKAFPQLVSFLLVFALLVGMVNVAPVLADYGQEVDYGYSAANDDEADDGYLVSEDEADYAEDDTVDDEYEKVVFSSYEEIAPAYVGVEPFSNATATFRFYGTQGLRLDDRARYPDVYNRTVTIGSVYDLMGPLTDQVYGIRIYTYYYAHTSTGHIFMGGTNLPYTPANVELIAGRHRTITVLNPTALFPTPGDTTFGVTIETSRFNITGVSFLDYDGNVIVPANNIIPLQSVSINSGDLDVAPGFRTRLSAATLPITATNRGAHWYTSDASIVRTVNDWSGEIEAVGPGTTTITVRNRPTGWTITDTIEITVHDVLVLPEPQFASSIQIGPQTGPSPHAVFFANAFDRLGSAALDVAGVRVYIQGGGMYGHISPFYALPGTHPQRLAYVNANFQNADGGRRVFTYNTGAPIFTVADIERNEAMFRIDNSNNQTIVGYSFICWVGGVIEPADDDCPVTAVHIVQDGPLTIRPGTAAAVTLNSRVEPITAGNRNVTWFSDNTAVATVSAAGVVTGISGGIAVITAASAETPGITDTITVIVDAPIFTVNPPMQFGSGPPAHPGLNDAAFGTIQELMGAASANVTGVRLYAVQLYGGTTGQVRLGDTFDHHVGGGEGRLPWVRETTDVRSNGTLTIQSGAVVPASGTFGIEDMWWGSFNLAGFSFIDATGAAVPSSLGPSVVTSVEIDSNDFNLFVDCTRQLSAEVLPILAPNRAVTWTSSDPSVATVSATGLVTGVSFDAGAGYSTAVITAETTCGVLDTVTVAVVYGAPLESPQFPVDPPIYIGMGTTAHPGVSPFIIGIVADLVTPEVLELVAGIRLYGAYPVYGGSVGQFAFGDNLMNFGGNPGYTPWDRSTQAADGYATLTMQWDDPLFANGEDSTFGVAENWWGFFRLMGFSFLDVDGNVLPALPGGIVVTSVEIEQPNFTMMPTGTRQLSALVLPALASDRSVTWASSDETVATVSTTGLVTALTIGETTITAETVNGLTDTVDVTVVEGVVIDGPQFPANYVRNYNMVPRQLSFANAWEYLGENALQVTGLRVYVTNRYPGFTGAMSPVNPDGSGPSGSDRGMALNSGVFQNEGGHQFVVYQNYEQLFGLASLMANRAYFRMDFFWRYITIVGYTFINEFGGVVLPAEDLGPQPVASVIIDGGDLGLTEGGFADIVGIVMPLAAVNRDITWASSDQNVATIESTGNSTARITAINEGTTTITVTTVEGGFTDSIEVTVSAQVFEYEDGVFTPVPPIRLYDLPDNDEFIFNVGRMLGDRALDVAGVRLYAEITGPGSHGGSLSYGQRHTFIAPGNYGPHATRWGSTTGDVPIANGILPFTRNYTFFTQADLDNDAALFFVELWWASSHQLQINAITFLGIDGNPISPAPPRQIVSVALDYTQAVTAYYVGDVLDVSGLVIIVTYDNGDIRNVPVTTAMVSGFNSSVPNAALVLTVTYNDVGRPFTVSVAARPEPCCDDYPGCDCDEEPAPCCDDYPDCNCDEEPYVDLTDLRALVSEALALNQNAYTAASWANMAAARAAAQTVLGNPEATQDEIDAAYTALRYALNALVRVQVVLPQPPVLPPAPLPPAPPATTPPSATPFIPWTPRTPAGQPADDVSVQYEAYDDDAPGEVLYEVYEEEVYEEAAPPLPTMNTLIFTIGNIQYLLNDSARTSVGVPFIDPATDRMMIPLRTLSEALGVEVEWDSATRSAIIYLPTGTLVIPVDEMLPDGMGSTMIVNDRAFIPLRFVMYAFNKTVEWDSANRAAVITW